MNGGSVNIGGIGSDHNVVTVSGMEKISRGVAISAIFPVLTDGTEGDDTDGLSVHCMKREVAHGFARCLKPVNESCGAIGCEVRVEFEMGTGQLKPRVGRKHSFSD
jgi:hypothetical protein